MRPNSDETMTPEMAAAILKERGFVPNKEAVEKLAQIMLDGKWDEGTPAYFPEDRQLMKTTFGETAVEVYNHQGAIITIPYETIVGISQVDVETQSITYLAGILWTILIVAAKEGHMQPYFNWLAKNTEECLPQDQPFTASTS